MTESFRTGDILLCSTRSPPPPSGTARIATGLMGMFDALIRQFTQSHITHVAMVLKDPSFMATPPLQGLYVWESSYEPGIPDPQDGNACKIGVRMTPLDAFLESIEKGGGHVLVRKVWTRDQETYEATFSNRTLKKIHDVVYDKPYDIVPRDWIEAAFDPSVCSHSTTDRFWCSAFVAYILVRCGVLSKNTQWTVTRPSAFSIESEDLDFDAPTMVTLSGREELVRSGGGGLEGPSARCGP